MYNIDILGVLKPFYWLNLFRYHFGLLLSSITIVVLADRLKGSLYLWSIFRKKKYEAVPHIFFTIKLYQIGQRHK